MTVEITKQWINKHGDVCFEFSGMNEVSIGDTITVTNNTSDEMRTWYMGDPDYDRGTTLLRNAAQAAEDYIQQQVTSRRFWPSRKKLRNV